MKSKTCGRFASALLARALVATAAAAAAATGACAAQAVSGPEGSERAGAMRPEAWSEASSEALPGALPEAEALPEALPEALIDAFDPPGERSSPPPRPPRATATDGRTLQRLLEAGEAAYRARRRDEALAAFERAVALDPRQALAWLRIGNLHQMRRDWFRALAAYRKAAARSGEPPEDPAVRAKALYNLALINLELAQQTLRTLERLGPEAIAAGAREPLSAAVAATRRRLDARLPSGERPGAATGDDRPRPRVDYIRGAPKP